MSRQGGRQSESTAGGALDNAQVLETHEIGVGEGIAFTARAGQIVEFRPTRSTQVIDLNLFRLQDQREHFSASVTRPIHGTHLVEGDRLLTCSPWEREIALVHRDTLQGRVVSHEGSPTRSHDLLFGRCSASLRQHLYGFRSQGCQEILSAAIEPHGLSELAVHDPLNIFMRTGVDGEGNIFFADPEAGPEDAFALVLATDALVAFSCCPGRSSGPAPGGATVTVSRQDLSPDPRAQLSGERMSD